jgi:hypothetical protein
VLPDAAVTANGDGTSGILSEREVPVVGGLVMATEVETGDRIGLEMSDSSNEDPKLLPASLLLLPMWGVGAGVLSSEAAALLRLGRAFSFGANRV